MDGMLQPSQSTILNNVALFHMKCVQYPNSATVINSLISGVLAYDINSLVSTAIKGHFNYIHKFLAST